MKIPENPGARAQFIEELSRKCLISQDDRRRKYAKLKHYYMTGCAEDYAPERTINKIYPHLDQLTSFMYSQETTRFSVNIEANVSDMELSMVPALNQSINDEWHASNTDIVFSTALTWAFVYSSMFVKPIWRRNSIQPFLIDPHNFGVLREDVPQLSRQEAFIHSYMKTQTDLESELVMADHPRKGEILKSVVPSSRPTYDDSGTVGNIVVSATNPNIVGNVNVNLTSLMDYVPKVADDLVQMHELYIWNDDINDFQVITLAEPFIPIYDRAIERLFIKNEIPIIQICPSPAPDYFWGYSECERLIPLQDMRNKRLDQVRTMMDRQADPPRVFSGFPGVTDEMANGMRTPSGWVQSDMSGSKVEELSPQIPDDLFQEIRDIDAMFEEMSGINNVLSGRGEQGVRSTGHAAQLARLGSSRAKKRALIVEDSLEALATLYLKMMKKYSPERFKSEDGDQFVADQFTDDFIVKVDAHSNSPIFSEDQMQIALMLFKAKAIDRESLIDLLDIPMKQLLKNKLKRKIEPSEAQAAKQQQVLELRGVKPHKGKGAA